MSCPEACPVTRGGRVESLEDRSLPDPRPPHSQIFSRGDYFRQKVKKMADREGEEVQHIDLASRNIIGAKKHGISEPLICQGYAEAECVVCGGSFSPATSRANVCSTQCRRMRKLRYGAEYRADIRQRRADILAKFGGQAPTREDFLRLLQARKAK